MADPRPPPSLHIFLTKHNSETNWCSHDYIGKTEWAPEKCPHMWGVHKVSFYCIFLSNLYKSIKVKNLESPVLFTHFPFFRRYSIFYIPSVPSEYI